MEEVQALCTRIGIMDHGKLIACDTLAALLRQLPGLIRCRLLASAPGLRPPLEALPGVRLVAPDTDVLTLECDDVRATLVRLLALLSEHKAELASLEMEEPNLERVFLHLTGRALRD
jgi:ABC-2 type transport system ATP-binding protein